MNPQAINDAFKLFASKGYQGNEQEFISLISSNPQAFDDAFKLFASKGYQGGEDGFSNLMGIGKKKDEGLPSTTPEEGVDLSTQESQEEFLSGGLSKDDVRLPDLQLRDEETVSDVLEKEVEEKDKFEEEYLKEAELMIRRETDPYAGTLLEQDAPDDFEQSMEGIDEEMIQQSEEFTVPKLNYELNKYGFYFSQTGLGDAMNVESMNGQQTRIDLQPFTGRGKASEVKKLKEFLESNKEASERAEQQFAAEEDKIRRVYDEKEIKETVSVFNQQTEELKKDKAFHRQANIESDKLYQELFGNISAEEILADPVKKEAYDKWYEGRRAFELADKEIKEREADIIKNGLKLDRMAAQYAEMKAKQGDWYGGLYNGILTGFGKEASAIAGTSVDLAVEMGIGENIPKKKGRIIDEAIEYFEEEGKGIDTKKLREDMSAMTMEELKDYLSGFDTQQVEKKAETRLTSMGVERPDEKINLYDYADAKVKDYTKKAIKYFDSDYESAKAGRQVNPYSVTATQELSPKGMMDAVRKSLVKEFGAKGTTEQWASMQKEGFWGGAILGLAESLPAMIGGKGITGATQRLVQMTSQATDAIDEEMSNNPEFDNISENEKYYIKAPVGVAVGVLENIGFRNVISQKGLLNSVVAKALGKSTNKTTAKQFGDFIREDIDNRLTRGLLTVTAAGLAEFETGAAQEAATLAVKDIYNLSKEKDMFKTPDTWIEYATEIGYAGAQELIGGKIMGVIPAISNAMYTKDAANIVTEDFELFDQMSKDPAFISMYETQLKQKLATNEITQEEADKQFARVQQIQGIMGKVRDDFSPRAKAYAIQLLLEKKQLTDKKQNKDESLVKDINDRINEIEDELTALQVQETQRMREEEEEVEAAKLGISPLGDTAIESVEVENIEDVNEVNPTTRYRFSFEEGKVPAKYQKLKPTTKGTLTIGKGKNQKTLEQFTVSGQELIDAGLATEAQVVEETQRQKDIAEMFEEEIKEVETVTNNLAINSRGKIDKRTSDDNSRIATVIRNAKKGARAISKLLPKTKIVLHESQPEYQKFTNDTGNGFFDSKTNTIHINLSKSTNTTVAHEVFHAVLLNKIKSDTTLQSLVKNMVVSVNKTLQNKPELSQKLDDFVQMYEDKGENIMNEERLAELAGLLAAEYETLSPPSKSIVMDFIRKVAAKFGIELPSSFGKTDQSVIDLLNSIAIKTREGQEITEQDVRVLEEVVEEDTPPVREGRQQRSVRQIIAEAREADFNEAEVRDLLVRRMGMKAKVVDKELANFVDLFKEFRDMPKSFGDMKGGLSAAKGLYNKLKAYHTKLVRNNKRRVERNRISKQEIMDKTIDYMESLPEFKAQADMVVKNGKSVAKKGYSMQQARMVSDLQKMVNATPTQGITQRIVEVRKLIRERKRAKTSLKQIKIKLKNLLRKTLPESMYTRKDVLELLQKIAVVEDENINSVMEEVMAIVVRKNNENLENKINAILGKKTTKVESGRLKGTRISLRVKEAMDFIKENILNKESTALDIDNKNLILNKRFQELSELPNPTEKDMLEMAAIKVVMEYNNSLQMSDTSPSKTESLGFVLDSLQEIDTLGRTEFEAELALEKEQYQKDFAIAYKEILSTILGDQEINDALDFSDPKKSEEQLRENRIDLKDQQAAKTVDKALKRVLRNISQRVRLVFTAQEALDGLIDLISKLPGELFGGKLQEITTELVDQSSRTYKARKMYVEGLVVQKLEEIYGKKNWQKETRKNNIPKRVTLGKKKKVLSQNQMYYLYNQYKDPANHASFKEKYGKNYKEIMKDMEAALDDKVKAFADWQVNEFFPSVYSHYNKVYQKVYKTNMPFNENYAGRIYREGVTPQELDLLGNKSVLQTAVGAASTKERVNNNNPIEDINGNDALFSYINDMEYFAAYAENIKRINKMFTNKDIQNAIVSIHGKATYGIIKESIQRIANKGTRNPLMAQLMNAMNNVYILSRIALSPLITIKQLTSLFTYANDIGAKNWTKYSGISLTQARKTYKEMRDNSVYMQDRGRTPITQVIESYSNVGDLQRTRIIPEAVLSRLPYWATKDNLIKIAMYNVKAGDAAAIYMGGMPNYLYYKDQYRKAKPNATEQEVIDYAIKKFEKDTKRTQQSSDLQDRDFFQTGDPIVRSLNMFLTTPKQYLRKEIQATRNLYRKIKAFDKNAGKGTIWENVRTLLMYHFFMPILFQYISMGLPGMLRGWRDDDDEDLFRAAILGNLNAIFVLGEVATFVADAIQQKKYAGEQFRSLGILNTAQRLTRLYMRAANTKTPETKEANMKKFYLELMTVTGLPAPTLEKMIDNYSKLGTEEDIGMAIMRLLNYSDYQKFGPDYKRDKSQTQTIQELNEEYEREQRRIERESKRAEDLLGGGSKQDDLLRGGSNKSGNSLLGN